MGKRMRKKTRGTIASIVLAALLVFALALIAGFTDREIPDNPISAPQEAIAVPQMLVAPSNEEGDAEGDSNTDEPTQQEQQEQQEQQSQMSRDSDPEQSSSASSAFTAGTSTVTSQTGTAGDTTSGSSTSGGTSGEAGQGTSLRITTNLKNSNVTKSDLNSAGELEFYAYLTNPQDGIELRINLRNKSLSGNGTWLSSADGKNYAAELALGTNTFTLYTYKGGSIANSTTITVVYSAEKASEGNPTVGDNPPSITTNLDNGENADISATPFTFTVKAKDYKGKTISYDHITVALDGQTVQKSSGDSGTYDYDLSFKSPNYGDEEEHTVTVVAWDSEGNSRWESFTVTYHYTNPNEKVGDITVRFDFTNLGLGVGESISVEIRQDEALSTALEEALEPQGYSFTWKGSYLAGISYGGIAKNFDVPDTLLDRLDRDGVKLSSPSSANELLEKDFTQGSGWMYMVDGEMAGRDIGSFNPHDGQTVTLLFTLAWGKDFGEESSNGILRTYCGTWMNGEYTENHSIPESSYKTIKEPTCTKTGEAAYSCSECGALSSVTGTYADGKAIEVPALGHKWELSKQLKPSEDEVGYVVYTCSRCKETLSLDWYYGQDEPTPDNPNTTPSDNSSAGSDSDSGSGSDEESESGPDSSSDEGSG